jgi:hypothetical protein
VILLDLATDGKTTVHDVVECIPGQPAVKDELRATRFGAPASPTGCPDNEADWTRCTDALTQLAYTAKQQAEAARTIGAHVRFWIAGNAGLPVFFLFGHLMSRWGGAITLVHKEGSAPGQHANSRQRSTARSRSIEPSRPRSGTPSLVST